MVFGSLQSILEGIQQYEKKVREEEMPSDSNEQEQELNEVKED